MSIQSSACDASGAAVAVAAVTASAALAAPGSPSPAGGSARPPESSLASSARRRWREKGLDRKAAKPA